MADTLTPVDGDPWAGVTLTPVDRDPFADFPAKYASTPTPYDFTPDAPTAPPQHQWTADDLTAEWQRQREEPYVEGAARLALPFANFVTHSHMDLARPVVSLVTGPHDAMYGTDTPGALYGTPSPSIDQRGIEGAALLAGGPVASAEEGEISAASKLLESRNARIYNPPDVGPRPFSDDYSGVSGNGPLRTDIDGRPLGAAFIAGRRTVGGADEALSPAQLDAGIQGTLGAPPQAVAQGTLPRRAVGAYRVVRGPDGPERAIVVSQNLSAPAKDMVAAHEFGHAIDDLAGGIDATQGMRDELGKVYNDLNNPSMSPNVGKPWSPQAFGYKGSDADRELIAEAIRAYAVNPNYLKSVAPNTASAIRAAVNANPRLSQTIQFNAGSKPLAAMGDAAEAGEEGAFGAGGGNLTQPSINWDRSTVGNGWSRQAIQEGGGPETTVLEAPVHALESAFKASNPNFYIASPKQQVVDYAKSGQPMSLPEIGVTHGQLGFQNGRNRFAAARDMGADTIPVAVENDNLPAVQELLAKHTMPGRDGVHNK